jgi:predicted enzyme related to lactoylglutathione lyase
MAKPEVRHVLTIIAVTRFRESVDFYQAAFGWDMPVETPAYVELALPGGQRFGIYEREGFGRNIGRAPAEIAEGETAPIELYFHTDDLAAAIDRLTSAGARVLSPLAVRPWGDEAAYFADPSGNVLVLARPAPASAP